MKTSESLEEFLRLFFRLPNHSYARKEPKTLFQQKEGPCSTTLKASPKSMNALLLSRTSRRKPLYKA